MHFIYMQLMRIDLAYKISCYCFRLDRGCVSEEVLFLVDNLIAIDDNPEQPGQCVQAEADVVPGVGGDGDNLVPELHHLILPWDWVIVYQSNPLCQSWVVFQVLNIHLKPLGPVLFKDGNKVIFCEHEF